MNVYIAMKITYENDWWYELEHNVPTLNGGIKTVKFKISKEYCTVGDVEGYANVPEWLFDFGVWGCA